AQRKSKSTQPNARASSAQPSAAEMQREIQNATPGAAHESLAKLAGNYTTVSRFFAQPGAAPIESAGEATLSMTLDGRFLAEEDPGNVFGHPSKSLKMVGYNNASKRYEGIWTYTMSTAIMALNGSSVDGGKTVSFAASFDDAGGVKEKLSIVMRRADDDHF